MPYLAFLADDAEGDILYRCLEEVSLVVLKVQLVVAR